MNNRIAKVLLVLLTPVAASGLLALGAVYRDHLGGRLLQVTGGFLTLVWLVGTFLLVGAFMTRASGYRGVDPGSMARNAEVSSPRSRRDPEELRP